MARISLILFILFNANSGLSVCDDFRLFSVLTFVNTEKLTTLKIRSADLDYAVQSKRRELDQAILTYRESLPLFKNKVITEKDLQNRRLDMDDAELQHKEAKMARKLVDIEVKARLEELKASCQKVSLPAAKLLEISKIYVEKWALRTSLDKERLNIEERKFEQNLNIYKLALRQAGKSYISKNEFLVAKRAFELQSLFFHARKIKTELRSEMLKKFEEISSKAVALK